MRRILRDILRPNTTRLSPTAIPRAWRSNVPRLREGRGLDAGMRDLRLNARVLGFNVDPAFGDALDALLTVDLLEIDPAILARYLGKPGAAAFTAFHQRRAA